MAKASKDKAKKKGAAAAGSEWPAISVSAHPRATRSIRQSKAWAGLAAFVLVGWFSRQAGVDDFEVGVRALLAGVVFYIVTWALSVALWQRLVVHEAKVEAERRRDERAEALRRMMEANNPGTSGDDGEAAA
jgi:hypothetical protein